MARKTILMMLLIIGMLSSFTSCKKNIEKTYFENYAYTNNSNHTIQIQCYYTLSNVRESVYTIEKGTELQLKQELSFGQIDSLIINADSLKITFDDAKNIIYHRSDTSRYNIIERNNYEVSGENEKERTYQYIFTDNDFDQAQ